MDPIKLTPVIKKNDTLARWLIFSVSLIVFLVVVILKNVRWEVSLPFNVHFFAQLNAAINTLVAIALLGGLYFAKKANYQRHKRIMMRAIFLSVLFLLSYIAHHLLAGNTYFGDTDHDGLVSAAETAAAGPWRNIYYFILLTHIPLAGIILPFILFTAYRSLCGEYEKHKKLARITWPIWFYVAVTGVLVYVLISPYYN